MQKAKIQRRPVHGVLLLDKPSGLSSNEALQKAKWLLRAQKAGHTGTLDPLATGLLPLCFGAATKFSQIALDAHKTYLAQVTLGVTTTTDDAEGEVLTLREAALDRIQIEAVLARFRGAIEQTPPIYSALKREGKALYEYARAGVEIDIAPRAVHIFDLRLLGDPLALPSEPYLKKNELHVGAKWSLLAIDLIVTCSKGTYIRSLARDIGAALGCGAHLSRLRRVATAGFEIGQAITLEALSELSEEHRVNRLLPAQSLLGAAARVELTESEAGRFLSGLRRRTPLGNTDLAAVFGPALPGHSQPAFLGSARIYSGELIPTRLLSPIEVGEAAVQFSASTSTKQTS